ncbi:hypothetical protein [Streptomyces sp. WAC00263]|nr:hypothetical protein [Streptomyces sp. WAC00263]
MAQPTRSTVPVPDTVQHTEQARLIDVPSGSRMDKCAIRPIPRQPR